MEIYEIIVGVVLIIACLLIIVFTLAQEQKGQGLSAAIMGDNSFMAAGRERGLDAKLAKLTRVLGVVSWSLRWWSAWLTAACNLFLPSNGPPMFRGPFFVGSI